MARTRIKICGITTPEDAAAAVAAGADALGVVFAPSRRQLDIERAAEVLADVPPPVGRIGVFVDADPGFVREAALRCGLTAVQLHGAEPPSVCAALRVPVVKAFRVRDGADGPMWDSVEPYRGNAAAFLFDTYSAAAEGGTGESFEWARVVPVPGWARVFLAGGLTPENVGEAIAAVRPFAVDVSSGVESAPGVKDAELMELFVAAVRAADKEATKP